MRSCVTGKTSCEGSWDAGFVSRDHLASFCRHQDLRVWHWKKPGLIVVDYAATYTQDLNRWFEQLADYQGPADQPLRILLLERQADTATVWWQTTFGQGSFCDLSIQQMLEPAEPVPLLPLAASEDRREKSLAE